MNSNIITIFEKRGLQKSRVTAPGRVATWKERKAGSRSRSKFKNKPRFGAGLRRFGPSTAAQSHFRRRPSARVPRSEKTKPKTGEGRASAPLPTHPSLPPGRSDFPTVCACNNTIARNQASSGGRSRRSQTWTNDIIHPILVLHHSPSTHRIPRRSTLSGQQSSCLLLSTNERPLISPTIRQSLTFPCHPIEQVSTCIAITPDGHHPRRDPVARHTRNTHHHTKPPTHWRPRQPPLAPWAGCIDSLAPAE